MQNPAAERVWLLLTALCAGYPAREDVDQLRRELQLSSSAAAMRTVLASSLPLAQRFGDVAASIEVVEYGVVVDVDYAAKFELHTGIQRVCRSLLPIWVAEHDVVPAAWNASKGALRRLSPFESDRVLRWGQSPAPESVTEEHPHSRAARTVLVPWRSVVVMIEVPGSPVADMLAAVGAQSPNVLVGVAHDTIPVVSADMVPPEESTRFVQYLSAVKFATRIAGVSAAARDEIQGFTHALKAQGLVGPIVTEVPLGAPAVTEPSVAPPRSASPHVLVVGSHEPRKNHLAILHSAERLWREGCEFTLTFIGGSGWGEDFPRAVARLLADGRTVDVKRAVTDAELMRAYDTASFTVFPSLHEGFGLPVVESLTHGTPVITSKFGATAEIGEGGGVLLIDPRNDAELTEAMRTLLTEPSTLSRLRREIRERPSRGWDRYASELWDWLVEPVYVAASPSIGAGPDA